MICFFFVFSANIEIARVRKSNESEIAVMKAALKKEQTKSASLEMSLQQKVCISSTKPPLFFFVLSPYDILVPLLYHK